MYVATRPLTLNGATYAPGAVVDVAAIAPRTIARLVAHRRLVHGDTESPRATQRADKRAR